MENPEEILHSLEEFTKLKPKDIPRELEEYLCFVAKTGDPVYQWSSVKSLFREKLINVITEFYESCPSVEIPPCPNVDVFNYEIMKNFILEKLDTFANAPFTVQRISELLTTPRKEYNRIDKYMRALEKNILVVSTTEPGNRRAAENGEGIMNGIDSENGYETNNSNNDINVEEMDDAPSWPRLNQSYPTAEISEPQTTQPAEIVQETFVAESTSNETACTSSADTVITKTNEPYVSIEPIASDSCTRQEEVQDSDVSVTITAIPAAVQKRRDSIEPVVSSEQTDQVTESSSSSVKELQEDIVQKEEVPTEEIKPAEIDEPVIKVESTSATQSESTVVSCSETPEEPSPPESTVEEPTSEISSQSEEKEKESEDTRLSDVKSDVVVSSEDVSQGSEISTSSSEDEKSAVPEDDTKDNLISSSDEVESTVSEQVEEKEEREPHNEVESTQETAEIGDTEIVEPKQIVESNDNTETTKPEVIEKSETDSCETPMEVDVEEQTPSKEEEAPVV